MLHKHRVEETIRQAWSLNSHNQNLSVVARLRHCRKALSRWKKDNQANYLERISQLQSDLEVEQSSMNPSSSQVYRIHRELIKAYRDEENFWK